MICVKRCAETANSEHQSEKDDYRKCIFHQRASGLITSKPHAPRCLPDWHSAGFNVLLKFAIVNQTGLTLMAEVRLTVIEAGRNDELKTALKVPDAVTES
jgi:hypothetical protein